VYIGSFERLSQYKCPTLRAPQRFHRRRRNRSYPSRAYIKIIPIASSAFKERKRLFTKLKIQKGSHGIRKLQIHDCTSFISYAKLDLCSNLFDCG
jgi:hypothetical protein